ncbi:MAG: hypothetical protein WCA17_00010 [Burkholderiales bacterium]
MGTQRELPDAQNLLHYLELIAAAEAPADVLDAVQRYLDAWPKARIKALQKIDGGWAPFSQRQAPSRINGVRDLRRVRDAVYGQCAALRQAGVQLTPELMELDEILFVATRLAESMRTPEYKARAAGNTGRLRLAKLV